MLEKRFWSKIPYILFGVLTCLTVWQIIRPRLPSKISQYSNTVYTLYTYNSTRYSYPTHILPNSDYNRLIDLNFTFEILNIVCNDSSPPLLLVVVHSSPKNFAKRKTIRETWGRKTQKVKVLFMIGSVNNSYLQKSLDDENKLHNDFVQGSFLDTYRNITYKHVMVFKYIIYHCPQAKYILKTDDDVFVNMPTMKNFLSVDLSPYGARNLLFCTIRSNSKVLRTYRSKWRVSFSEYPQRSYPSYCPGWTLLYSPDVVFTLYKEAQEAEYFWIDDIHITGTLAKRAHVKHTNIEPLVISEEDLHYIVEYSHNITKPFLYGRANLKEKEIRSLWRFALTHAPPKSILKSFH